MILPIFLSRGEEVNKGRQNPSILADTFESVLGAIYLDQGWQTVSDFLSGLLIPEINRLSKNSVYKDPKSLFQEIAQAKKGITPHYVTLKEQGPDHKKVFEVAVYLNEQLVATGVGPSKQLAEEDASTKATKIINDLV